MLNHFFKFTTMTRNMISRRSHQKANFRPGNLERAAVRSFHRQRETSKRRLVRSKSPKNVAAGFLILILAVGSNARSEGNHEGGTPVWRRETRYYRRRNITQKIAGVTPSSLVNYRELPIIIRTVKVFTIVVGQAARSRDAEPQWAHLVCEFAEVYPPGFASPPSSSSLRCIHLSPKRQYEIHLMRHFANKSFPSSRWPAARDRPICDLRFITTRYFDDNSSFVTLLSIIVSRVQDYSYNFARKSVVMLNKNLI